MRRECREGFPRRRIQRKPPVSDPSMHHDTCVTHVPWCMSRSLIRGGGEDVPGIPGSCAIGNFTYLVRGPWQECTLFLVVKLMIKTYPACDTKCIYSVNKVCVCVIPGIILSMATANERRHYIITSSLVGCAYSQNDPCIPRTSAVPFLQVDVILGVEFRHSTATNR